MKPWPKQRDWDPDLDVLIEEDDGYEDQTSLSIEDNARSRMAECGDFEGGMPDQEECA